MPPNVYARSATLLSVEVVGLRSVSRYLLLQLVHGISNHRRRSTASSCCQHAAVHGLVTSASITPDCYSWLWPSQALEFDGSKVLRSSSFTKSGAAPFSSPLPIKATGQSARAIFVARMTAFSQMLHSAKTASGASQGDFPYSISRKTDRSQASHSVWIFSGVRLALRPHSSKSLKTCPCLPTRNTS